MAGQDFFPWARKPVQKNAPDESNVVIFKIFSSKNSAKKLALFDSKQS
jgi:hypothetical protein